MTEEEIKKKEQKKQKRKRSQQKKKAKWFEARMNTFVYVSGLPLNIDEEELKVFFNKCGAIMIDPNTGQAKIRVYRDQSGAVKGDARICYSNIESVQMAIEWLDSQEIRPGYTVKVEEATF